MTQEQVKLSEQQLETFDIDALLDGDSDQLLDTKVFTPLPIGQYVMQFGWKPATMADDGYVGVTLTMKLLEVLALANPEHAAMFEENGIFHGEDIARNVKCRFFNRKGEPSSYGQGMVKDICQAFIDAGQASADENGKFKISQVLNDITGFSCLVDIRHRRSDTDKDVFFEEYKSILPDTRN